VNNNQNEALLVLIMLEIVLGFWAVYETIAGEITPVFCVIFIVGVICFIVANTIRYLNIKSVYYNIFDVLNNLTLVSLMICLFCWENNVETRFVYSLGIGMAVIGAGVSLKIIMRKVRNSGCVSGPQ
jgi:hypothetical protein